MSQAQQSSPKFQSAILVAANLICVVGVITVNKFIYRSGFKFPSTLMAFHFLCTWVFVALAHRMEWFEEKRIAWWIYASRAFIQMLCVAFLNLSLLNNPLGTYQLFKFTVMFVMCILEYSLLARVYSLRLYVSICAIVVCVSFMCVHQVGFSALGAVCGALASLFTAVDQVGSKLTQTTYKVSALQLLQFELPFSVLFMMGFALVSEPVLMIPNTNFTTPMISLIALSGVFAFGVNVSAYLIIGKTSPLTYAVVGHVKTILVLIVGFALFREVATTNQLVGMSGAFIAIVIYTHLSSQEPKPTDGNVFKLGPCCESDEEEAQRLASETRGGGSDNSNNDNNNSHPTQSPWTVLRRFIMALAVVTPIICFIGLGAIIAKTNMTSTGTVQALSTVAPSTPTAAPPAQGGSGSSGSGGSLAPSPSSSSTTTSSSSSTVVDVIAPSAAPPRVTNEPAASPADAAK